MNNNFCKDCHRLQRKPSGTGPPRPKFVPSTKYDHYSNFQEFKESRKEEHSINQRKEELLKFNTDFTDLNLNRDLTKAEFEQFSTQDIAKFRKQLRMGSCDRNLPIAIKEAEQRDKEKTERKGHHDDDDRTSLQKKKSPLALTRTPIQCPISTCQRTIGSAFVLSHFLRDHSEDFPCQEIYTEKPSVLVFDPNTLEFQVNVCLGVLAYGGEVESSSRPAERGLCKNNVFLPQPYEHLTSHMPILIMACRTSWLALLDSNIKELQRNIHNPNYTTQELLVVWLASVQTVKPIHCTVTLYDKELTSSRSSIMQVRDLSDSQNPSVFMLTDTNFVRLSHGDINILSPLPDECIHMELMINEYE